MHDCQVKYAVSPHKITRMVHATSPRPGEGEGHGDGLDEGSLAQALDVVRDLAEPPGSGLFLGRSGVI